MTEYPRGLGPPTGTGATGVCSFVGMFMGMAAVLYLKLDLYVGMLAALALGAATGALAGGLIGYCVDRVNGFRSSTLGGLVGFVVGYVLAIVILRSYDYSPHYFVFYVLGGLPGALVGDYIERRLLAPDRANPIGVFIAMIIIIAVLASGILSWGTESL